jgi:PAS domain S-box-containing protein
MPDRALLLQELVLTKQRLELATRSSGIGVWDWDVIDNELIWDDRMLALYGLTRANFPGGVAAWERGLHPKDRDKAVEEIQAALRGDTEWDTEFRVLHPDGTVKHIKAKGMVMWDAEKKPVRMLGVNYDITERKHMEYQLRRYNARLENEVEERTASLNASLKDKEMLLKEVHHRVKNNLQVIVSMISLQKEGISDDAALTVFRDCEGRIRTMALIHDKLHQSSNFSTIDFGEYIDDLISELFHTYNVGGRNIDYSVDINVGQVDLDMSISCGLIINELVANALKYAFPVKGGSISISFTKMRDCSMVLVVKDDGIGVQKELNTRESRSLGVRMVYDLVVRKLKGTVELDTQNGTCWNIRFNPQQIDCTYSELMLELTLD